MSCATHASSTKDSPPWHMHSFLERGRGAPPPFPPHIVLSVVRWVHFIPPQVSPLFSRIVPSQMRLSVWPCQAVFDRFRLGTVVRMAGPGLRDLSRVDAHCVRLTTVGRVIGNAWMYAHASRSSTTLAGKTTSCTTSIEETNHVLGCTASWEEILLHAHRQRYSAIRIIGMGCVSSACTSYCRHDVRSSVSPLGVFELSLRHCNP